MKITGQGKMLRIYIGETDQWRGEPLYHAIVKKAHGLGLAGATVLRGIEGFGANSRIQTTRILRLSEDLPLVIEIVDREERIDLALRELDEMIQEGLMVLVHDVEVVKYQGRKDRDRA